MVTRGRRGRGDRLPGVLRASAATTCRSPACASTAPRPPTPAPGVLDAIADADAVVIAPSNPIVSIGPVLAVPGRARGGRGPARPTSWPSRRSSPAPPSRARPTGCCASSGHEASVVGVARLYARAGGHARDRRGRRRPRRRRRGRGRALRRRAARSCATPADAAALAARRARGASADEPARDLPRSRASPEIAARRRPGRPDRRRRGGRRHRAARRRRRRRHPEDRVEGRGPARRRRPRRSRWPQAARRAGVGADPAPPGRPDHQRDQARLRLRQRRHRPVERRARARPPCSPRTPTARPAASATASGPGPASRSA